eukprot:1155506-Pelagomonas_calceolata.AAC.8
MVARQGEFEFNITQLRLPSEVRHRGSSGVPENETYNKILYNEGREYDMLVSWAWLAHDEDAEQKKVEEGTHVDCFAVLGGLVKFGLLAFKEPHLSPPARAFLGQPQCELQGALAQEMMDETAARKKHFFADTFSLDIVDMSFMLVTTNPKPTDPPFKDYFFMFLKVCPPPLQQICSNVAVCSTATPARLSLLTMLP